MRAKGVYVRRPGVSICSPLVRCLRRNPLPAPWLPSQSHHTLPAGHCQPQSCIGTDQPYMLHPCHGASTLSMYCLSAPCMGDLSSWGGFATDAAAQAGTRQPDLYSAFKWNPIASNVRSSFMLGP